MTRSLRLVLGVLLLAACNDKPAPATGSAAPPVVATTPGSAAAVAQLPPDAANPSTVGSGSNPGSGSGSGSNFGSGSATASATGSGTGTGSGSAEPAPASDDPATRSVHWDYGDPRAAALLADDAIGGITPRTSVGDVIAKLGEPDKKLVFKHDEGQPENFLANGVWKSGILITFGAATAKGTPWIVSISCVKGTAKTQRGIGIGSTRAEVEAAYKAGKASEETMMHVAGIEGFGSMEEAEKAMFVVGEMFGMSFTFKHGKVTQIYWGSLR